MTEYVCWNCGTPLPAYDRNKIGFREECDKCHADLHVCKNCQFWFPGRPNECAIPGTDQVADREKRNFCEEFDLLGKKKPSGPSPDDIIKSLFN